jgi:hypothetical protein
MITEEQYNDLLEHLYNEGIEDPEALIMEMSDEELIELVEGYIDYNKGILPSGNTPRMKASYKAMGNSTPESGLMNSSDLKKRKRGNKIDIIDRRMTNIQSDKDKRDTLKNAKNKIVSLKREEVEILLDYLLAEGYVNDETSALKIVDCMSEGWITDVLEEKYVRGVSVGPKKGKGSDGQGSEENQRKRESTLSGGFRSKRGERREGRDNARGGFR